MAFKYRVRSRVLLGRLVALVVLLVAMGGVTALAAELPEDPIAIEKVFEQLQNSPIYKEACTQTCHGNIANTKNYSSAIIFQHGYHQLVSCSSCHPRFPHRPETTIERPTMKGCFDCHGVRHGPMGIIAADKCEACHVTPKARLRPAFHGYDWAGKPHVEPGEQDFNQQCAMCHQPASCTECHSRESVRWTPAAGWGYDSSNGCLSCHANINLTRQTQTGTKSFAVTGLDESAHSDITCQQCHTDYRYDDQPNASPLWNINVGQACADCHSKSEDPVSQAAVADYQNSIHGKELAEGNMDSATCASCHGGHFIFRLDTAAAERRMHASSYRVCGRCHEDYYESYDDYYHGRAYKAGTPDAPACWQCHGSHAVLPKRDAGSLIAANNIATTCAGDGCHAGTSEQFGEKAGSLIHEKASVRDSNPLFRLISRIRGR
jgi:hypothetical protein